MSSPETPIIINTITPIIIRMDIMREIQMVLCGRGMWGCGGEEQSGKEKEKEKKTVGKTLEKRLLTVRHSFSFSLASEFKLFPSRIPQFPQNTSLSLIVDEHTNTHIPHSYLSYKSTIIHVLTRIQITPQLLILLFQTTHSISPSLSLSQNNHFSCESSKSISSSLLSFISLDSRM